MDGCGRLWTAMDSEPFVSGRYGPQRTAMDGLRPSTDQKVGDSSSSGRASKALDGKGYFAWPAMDRMTFGSHSGSHSLRCDPNRGTATGPEPPNRWPSEPLRKCRSRAGDPDVRYRSRSGDLRRLRMEVMTAKRAAIYEGFAWLGGVLAMALCA